MLAKSLLRGLKQYSPAYVTDRGQLRGTLKNLGQQSHDLENSGTNKNCLSAEIYNRDYTYGKNVNIIKLKEIRSINEM